MNTLAKLHLCSNREEGIRLLNGFTVAELKQLALAVCVPTHGKKADTVARIVESTIGIRLRQDAFGLRLRQDAFASFRRD